MMQHYFWTTVSMFLVVVVGLINRFIPISPEGYLDARPSIDRDLVYARRLGGAPLPFIIAAILLLAGIAFWILARRAKFSRLLRVLGFLMILGAWTPYVAAATLLMFGLLLLSWVVGGMGARTSYHTSWLDAGTNAMTAEEGHALWNGFVHASAVSHRKHVRWAFILCWGLAALLFASYANDPGGLYTRFPDSSSIPTPTILLVVVFVVAPIFLSALFELIRDPDIPHRADWPTIPDVRP